MRASPCEGADRSIFARLTIVHIFSDWNIVITMESFATETSPAAAKGSNPRVNDFLTHEKFGQASPYGQVDCSILEQHWFLMEID